MNKNMYIFISVITFQSFIFGMDTITDTTRRLFSAARDDFNLAHSCHTHATDFTKPGNSFDQTLTKTSILYYAKTAKAAAKNSNAIVDQAIAHHKAVSTSHQNSLAASEALQAVIDAKFYAKKTHKKAKEIYRLLR